MSFQYIPYIWPLLISAFITLALGFYVLLHRRHEKGFTSFILSMLMVTIWSLGNLLEMSGIDLTTKLFWANVQYFAYCYSPVTLLALCMEYTGQDRWLRNRKVLYTAIVPTIIIILVWTDRYHGLMRNHIHLVSSGSFSVIEKTYGPAFYIHAGYSHLLNIAAWVLLIRAAFFRKTIYRKQALALLLGVSLIVLPNILYISGLSPIKQFDITPVFFGPAGLIIVWGIFRFKMFDLVPLARARVIETMDAGVMVLDLQKRVLDINPALEKMIGIPRKEISIKKVQEVCKDYPELVHVCLDDAITQAEISISETTPPRTYEVLFSPLTNERGMLIGSVVLLYEITEKKKVQEIYLKQQWKLAVNEERERMARDLHDNLGQVMGYISLQAQGIRQELINNGIDIVSGKLDKLIEASQSAHVEIREYIQTARSTAYLDKDIVTVVKKELGVFENHTGVSVVLKIEGDCYINLKPNIWINVLGIVKEALNNIRKHAEASQVKVTLSLTQELLYISIEDDGKGFDISQKESNKKTKFGLDIMTERATEIGGSIDIISYVGVGSQILLRVLLKEGEHKCE